MSDKKYFVLFSCCAIVKGAMRSTICDIQRDSFEFIPNDLFEILQTHTDKTLTEIKEYFNNEYDSTIDEYFDFLVSKEYGFWYSRPNLFPKIDLTYISPSVITNAVLDYDDNSEYSISDLFLQLEYLGCKDVQIRFFCSVNYEKLEHILNKAEETRIRSIDIVVKDSYYQNDAQAIELIKKLSKITSITIHSSQTTGIVFNGYEGAKRVMRTSQIIDGASHCGVISPVYFSINIATITEGLLNNTCLNKKVSIDVNGHIKNCPSMSSSFGHISTTSLLEALESKGFKDMWSITKDQISICRDCEFRAICTDCRAFIQDSEDIYSKPAKCNYDPYTMLWA